MAVRWMEYALSEYSLILAEREEAEASLGKHPSSQSLSSVTESEDDVLLRAFQRLWAKSRESYHWLASLLHRHGSKYFEGRHTAAWKQQGWLALRASLLAYGIKTALVILPQLARGRIRSLAQFLNRKIWFPSSTLRLAGFFGSFVLAHASMESLRLPAWSSGLAAGLTLAIAPRSNRLPIALFGFVRALEVFGRWLCTEGYFPRMEHGDTILMTLASIQCVYAWIYEPQSLDPSYLSFLYKFGGHPIPIVKAVCANTRGLPVQEAEVFPILRKQGLCTEWDDPRFCIPRGGHWCQLAHPASTSCTASYLRFWIRSYRQSLGLYTPVFLLPLVLRLTQRLKGSKGRNSRNRSRSTFPIATSSEAEVEETQIRNPSAALQCARTLGPLQEFRSRILRPELHSPGGRVSFQRFLVSRLARFALSVARSATFLATYCSNGWGSVCFYAAVRGSVHPSAGIWSGLCCGLSVLLEAPSRRIELGLYVLMHALQSAGNLSLPWVLQMLGRQSGQPVPYLLRGPVFSVLLFAASASFLRLFLRTTKLPRKRFRFPSSTAPQTIEDDVEDGKESMVVVRPTTSRLLQFLFAIPY